MKVKGSDCWRTISDEIILGASRYTTINTVNLSTGADSISFRIPELKERRGNVNGEIPWRIGVDGMENYFGGFSVFENKNINLLYFVVRATPEFFFGPANEILNEVVEFIPEGESYDTVVVNLIIPPNMTFHEVVRLSHKIDYKRIDSVLYSCGYSIVVWPPLDLIFLDLPMGQHLDRN